MKEMKVLSIIIPSYNTEKYIEKNIGTFLDKRLFNDVEILLVDDGSIDKTAKIIDDYAKKYPNYIRAIHKKNGGHGSAINIGIKNAKGKYLKVIDADDWVDTENLIRLKDILFSNSADLIINPYIIINQMNGKKAIYGKYKQKYNSLFQFEKIMSSNYRLALHSVTINTKILRNNKIQLTEKCYYEDFQYTFYTIPYINKVMVLDYAVYYYLVGQKTQSVNAANGLKNISMYLKVLRDSISYFDKNSKQINDNTRIYMENCLIDFSRSMYNIFLKNKSSREVYDRMLEIDRAFKKYSDHFYQKVGERNLYIRLLRSENYTIYKIISLLFRVYKMREIL